MGCAASAPAPPPPTKEDVVEERRSTLGSKAYLGRAESMTMGVLPLAAAFDQFDKDGSSGLNVAELRAALEHLGIEASSDQANIILAQYDQYPDSVIDVKEFASIVRDIKLMIEFDLDADGGLNAAELRPCINSLGFQMDTNQVDHLMQRFDADRNGSIDLVELSSLVRTAKAFLKYDTDHSGAIDLDELRDALRKLGLHAGGLEAKALFRRYDADANGSIELHEFAVLVRDLQLYASFDTNFDGTIDAEELGRALGQLGLKHPATESSAAAQQVLEVWDLDGDGLLNLSEFSQLASDVRIFCDADAGGTGMLGLQELTTALGHLGIQEDAGVVLERYQGEGAAKDQLSLVAFGRAIRDLNAPKPTVQPKARMSRRPSAISIKPYKTSSLTDSKPDLEA